jgi:hypothetical protein
MSPQLDGARTPRFCKTVPSMRVPAEPPDPSYSFAVKISPGEIGVAF